jgi:pimeloyl-ACP methyl ester carboxylesterase
VIQRQSHSTIYVLDQDEALAFYRDTLDFEVRLRNHPAELARALRGMGTGSQPPLWDGLRGLDVPALAVAGELDGKFVALSRRMASLAPRMRSAVVPGAGHNVHAEAPEAYLDLLEGFLDAP